MEAIRFGWDVEANGFFEDHLDYSQIPYRLKDTFKIHCIVVIYDDKIIAFHDGPKFNFDGREFHIDYSRVDAKYSYTFNDYTPLNYTHRPLSDFPKFVNWIPEGSTAIGHNIINYDLLAIKLVYGLDYKVEVGMNTDLGDDYWNGRPINFDDTLVRSKTLNPDRYGGHSLRNLSAKADDKKMEFRYNMPADYRFEIFDADMLYYNIMDVKANIAVADDLDREMTAWDRNDKWHPAIKLEKQVIELITRQQHRGFKFDVALAEKNLAELDEMMAERKEKIEAIIPRRPATKGFMKDFTPPKIQFKKSGEISSNLEKFTAKLGAEIVEEDGDQFFLFEGVKYALPLPAGEPLVTSMKATINDTTHIKGWLISLGWNALEYKEKDLTVDAKKNKLSTVVTEQEKAKARERGIDPSTLVPQLDATINRYIEQTLTSPFIKDRLEFLELPYNPGMSLEQIELRMRHYFGKRLERGGGIKVQTNPSFTVGQDKELCPNLREFAEQNEDYGCITDITEYLTYRHRRNSILGGGVTFEDYEDEEDEQTAKGYLGNIRSDGRIPTPAGTCDAATSRMRHKLVVNVPRSTSLYGEKMRALFMADSNVAWQLGYDFASLEARIEGHYCWEHERDEAKPYCNSLIQEKPYDVHTMMAKRISEIIGRDFARSTAKNVKYGLIRPM